MGLSLMNLLPTRKVEQAELTQEDDTMSKLDNLRTMKMEAENAAARVAAAEEEAKQELREKIDELLTSSGFNLSDLYPKLSSGKPGRRRAEVRYRDPADPNNTWTGRGRTPTWLTAKVKDGAKLTDFAVSAAA